MGHKEHLVGVKPSPWVMKTAIIFRWLGDPVPCFSIFFISGLIQELWSRSPSIQFPAQLAVRSFKVQTIEIALHHCTILWWFNGKKAMCLKFELPKWHFLTYACNSKIFGAKLLLLKCFKSATKQSYPKTVSSSVQVLHKIADKSG